MFVKALRYHKNNLIDLIVSKHHDLVMSQPLPDTSKQAVGNRIRLTRLARDWKHQNQIADLLEISQQRWNTYEVGVTMIPPNILWRFMSLSGATSDWIYYGKMETLPAHLQQKILEIQASENSTSRTA